MVRPRYRFTLAVLAARALQPLIHASHVYKGRIPQLLDSPREIALDSVLTTLTCRGVAFEPRMKVVGAELLPTKASSRATLVVSAHTMLSSTLPRQFHDRGVAVSTAAVDAGMKVVGTTANVRVLLADRNLLLKVRELFAAGQHVFAMIDRPAPERRTVPVPTKRGVMQVATPLLQLARNANARILFYTALVDRRWNLTATIVEPPQHENTSIDDLLAQFGAFVDTHIHTAGR
ncbi:MAG TPA: hypothetical protein VF618_18285 [Thermoanaerobaculia bacterium]